MNRGILPLVSFLRVLVALAVPLLGWLSVGVASTLSVAGYVLRVWQTEDGLPQNMVTSAVQTQDGYLWFGTYAGLARFNGERFQVFDSANTLELTDRRISSLYEDSDGVLWIGHESGALTRYHQGRFQPFLPATGAEEAKIIGMGNDSRERLWVMREHGQLEAPLADLQVASLIAPERPTIMSWNRGQQGDIWVIENGVPATLVDETLIPLQLPAPKTDNYTFGVAAARDGSGVWIICDDRIRKWTPEGWAEDLGPTLWPTRSPCWCLELRDGTVAIGTIHSGLYLFFRDGRPPVHFDRSNGLPQNWVRFLHEDREGNLWVGAGSAGLVSLHTTAFTTLNSPDQWQGCSVLSVAPGRDNSLWIGTDGAGLYHYADGQWTHYDETDGLGGPYVPAVLETSAGEVWAGVNWWGGPTRLDHGRFVRPPHVEAEMSHVLALLELPGGDLLVGNREGLLRLGSGQSHRLIDAPQGAGDDVTALAIDASGRIWCGFAQGGLACLDGETVMFYDRDDGLGSNAVHCIYPDTSGALWIGTADNGLTRFQNGTFARLGQAQGLADNTICHILDDQLGNLWLSTRHGIQRIALAELDRCADGEISSVAGVTFDRTDGLPISEFLGGRQAAGCRTPDGRLWFASSKGLVSIDPRRIEINPVPPPVRIEAFSVDGQPIPVGASSTPRRLRPDHERLEFAFTGLSFTAPSKVRFKFRLEGIDNHWVDAGAERVAAYSRLPAGSYRFSVIACNNDGVWNLEGTSLAFTIAPFFWQTWWFTGLTLLSGAGLVALFAWNLTRRRMQKRLEQAERQHAIERERTRIAQDIHDDVGTSLSRISMLSQRRPEDLQHPERVASVFTSIYQTTREITRSLDEIVWAIDPRHDSLDSLVDYLCRFAQEFLAAAQIRCRLYLPLEVPNAPLSAEVRHSLFLAFKEALNNVVKHADASEVRLTLALRSDGFSLTIHDNGRGLGGETIGVRALDRLSTGNGLDNMRARLVQSGGRCEIVSDLGQGTRVTLTICMPMPSAASNPLPTHHDA